MEPSDERETREQHRDRMAREHPVRFTLRRVAIAVVEVVLGVLGIGALLGLLVRGLLPNLDFFPDLSMPQWLRDFEPPEWLRYIDPVHWISRLDVPWPDVGLPDWLTDSRTYWLPIVIALVVALGEIDRRRKSAEKRAEEE